MMSDYDVGYKKPPRHTRFKSGNTEYLKRKNRSAPKYGEAFRNILNARVPYRDGEKSRYERRMVLMVRKVFGSALQGNVGAAEMLLKMHAQLKQTGNINPTIFWVDEADMKL